MFSLKVLVILHFYEYLCAFSLLSLGTTDLRHGGGGIGGIGVGGAGVGGGMAGVGGGSGCIGGFVGGYSSNNYCNSLMARRRGSRSLKINDSMESIRHTPDSDVNSQSGTM